MAELCSILYLDDMRVPNDPSIDLVRNYDEFVAYLNEKGIPDAIFFDHDLATAHYEPEENWGKPIEYEKYKEKTGLDCARHIIENNLPLKFWAVHSMNVTGRKNIEAELRKYCPEGEIFGLTIPYTVAE